MEKFVGKDGRGYSLAELTAMSVGENWSNDACKGYVALAMKALDFRKKDIKLMLDQLEAVFDAFTVREATDYYGRGDY